MEAIIFFGSIIIGNWISGGKFKDLFDSNFEKEQKKTSSAGTDKVA